MAKSPSKSKEKGTKDEETQMDKKEVKDPKPGPEGDANGQADTQDAKADTQDAKDDTKKEEKSDKKAKKVVKKTVPHWATTKPNDAKSLKKMEPPSDMASAVVDAMTILTSERQTPLVSAFYLKRQLKAVYPSLPKFMFKRALKKAVDTNKIKPAKGSFRLVANPKNSGGKAKVKKTSKDVRSNEKLDDLIGNIFTWICEPKEASISLIKKYIDEHHTSLSTSGNMFRKAIENGISRGQLDRINGQGMTGTVQLVDGAKKTGTDFEDAIEDAIIACNEPKDASIPALKHYLSEYHTEFNVDKRPKVLMSCLERCEAKGWVVRISGKGMSGSFRLAVPYRPAPKELWGEWYEDPNKSTPSKAKKETAKYYGDSESEEESEESSDEDSDEEIMPKKKRGAPAPRKAPPPKKKKPAAKKPPPKKVPVAKKGRGRPKSKK